MKLNRIRGNGFIRPAILIPILLTSIIVIMGCGRGSLREPLSAEEQWADAQKHFENENYLEAVDLLNTFTLNYGGSTLVDSAQFLLAECHFLMKEYIVAESEYERLVRTYPQSPLVQDASFKIVLCNAYLVPNVHLDQNYTAQTVTSALSFLDDYPASNLPVHLAAKNTFGSSLVRIFSLGIYSPKKKSLPETLIFNTKVVYPYRSAALSRWLLRVITFGIYHPGPTPLSLPTVPEVSGGWVVNKALVDSRNQLAEKEYRAAQLYYKQKKYPAVVIYGDRLLDLYRDTPWAPPSLRLKGDAFLAMKKYYQAASVYQEYLNFPGIIPDPEVETKLKKCQEQLKPTKEPSEQGG